MTWWPWVSRERLEDVQAQLRASEVERARLLDLLLAKPVNPVPAQESVAPVRRPMSYIDELMPTPAGDEESVVTSANPIDRMLKRFDHKFGNGRKPAQFRAKAG